MKKLSVIIMALVVAFVGFGPMETYAAAPVKMVEVELGGGIVSPTEKLDFDKNRVGYNIQAEVRFNFKQAPFDVGVHVDGDSFSRTISLSKDMLKFSSINAMFVFDWNILRKSFFSPFVGVGAGASWLSGEKPLETGTIIKEKPTSFCVMPRLGVELFHRLRVTLYYKNTKREHNHFGLSAGLVIGGGKK